MKNIVFLLLMWLGCEGVEAQTFSEWFSQGKTQKKYLLAQIAALKVYTGYLEEGYEIAKTGLNVIDDFKSGEFNLHNSFFSSLKTVSPVVRNDGRVAEIISMQLTLAKRTRQLTTEIKKVGSFEPNELEYLQKVLSAVTDGCLSDLLSLSDIVTSGKLELTEDQRLERINELYTAVKDKYAFVQSFGNEVFALAAGRKHDTHENYLR